MPRHELSNADIHNATLPTNEQLQHPAETLPPEAKLALAKAKSRHAELKEKANVQTNTH